MSSQIRDLSKMPISWAQGKRNPLTSTTTPEFSCEESEPESGTDFQSDLEDFTSFFSTSGITYSLTRLDAESQARAFVGLTGRFDVTSCRETSDGFDFQLSERRRIHIATDAYKCTCLASRRRPGVACEHIFWLFDQIQGCLCTKAPSCDVLISKTGQCPEFSPVELLLHDTKLEVVANRLNWGYIGGNMESRAGMSRSQKVKDIMSAFSKVTLSEDFRPDLIETEEQSRTPEQCVVQGDFEATMFRLAVHDDGVFSSLCKAMPAGACAAIYFDKIQEKSRKLLTDFDRYCQTGTLPTDGTSVEVDKIIEQLRQNVYRIMTNVRIRAPYGAEGAAKALVKLLEEICNRNKDALEGNMWGRVSFRGEDEDQRNLYHQLIGKSDESSAVFILDALEQLLPTDLHQYQSILWAIVQKLEVNRAPRDYILKLSALARAAASATGATGQKRQVPASSEGTTKRTR